MVRIWCVPISELDRQHLLGEHAELHCIVGALLGKHKGYRNHPETLRFQNCIERLYSRHSEQVAEMVKRGYKHNSPLPPSGQTYTYTNSEYTRDHLDLISRKKQKLPS